MADNTVTNAGSGGDTIASDDIGGVKHQRVKISQGADGSATDVSSAAPLNVTLANTGANGTKILVTPDANSTVDVNKVAGTTTDTNSGLKSAGTQRVVLATDQPALTNKLLVTPDSVALPANQSVNVSQINGVTPLMGTGVMGTGSPRVTIASDNDPLIVKQATAGNLNATIVGTGTLAVQNTTQKNASPASTTMQNAATGNGNGTNLAVDGFSTAIVSITASVGMGGGTTINFEASSDNTTFVAVQAINVGTSTIATTTVATGDWQVDVTGYSFLRARISAYSSGTITIKGWPIGVPANSKVVNANIVANTATNQSTNVAQLAGTTTDTNSGSKSAGTLRVVLATDQPALTNKLLVTPDSVALPANQSVNNAQVAGTATSVNSGAKDAGTQRVILASDQTVVPISDNSSSLTVDNGGTFAVQESGTQVQVDDAAFTPAASKITMVGYEADESSTDSIDEGDGGAARMTLDRKQITTLQPHTTGGLTTAMFSGSDGSSILVATSQVVKASAGQLYGYYAYNPEAAVTFVHFYNTASASVTVGTTNPLFTIAIPAGSAANLTIPQGITFSNAGWAVAATTTAGGNTAPATGVSLVVWYM